VPGPSHYRGLTITLRHISFGRTPLDEWSARHIDLYMTTHKTHKTGTFMTLAEFESAIPARERSRTNALDCAGLWIGK